MLNDTNGYWDRDEIEAVYGVHHVYSTKKSKDEQAHQEKADLIVNAVLKSLDLDNDGRVSPEELEKVGLNGLPNFDDLGAEGHHYDVESEQYHSTPETQTDESYTHPEDLEHFAQHEAIERTEAEKEAKFQGISVEEVIQQHEEAEAASNANKDSDEGSQTQDASAPKITRVTPPEKQDPSVRFRDASAEAKSKGEWGSDGLRVPTNPSDRMRKNLPYKERMQYKFRRNWGDF
ncbi:hypothetical protein H0H92_012883 [Tricholoma furcatifolium]|nr:hypothetical protein H0H92_012883 [Tricholoma furcatifolium]